jgi:hypothetical protein
MNQIQSFQLCLLGLDQTHQLEQQLDHQLDLTNTPGSELLFIQHLAACHQLKELDLAL